MDRQFWTCSSHKSFNIWVNSLLGFTIFICTCLQDMQDMRNCYDSLLSAAAATANSAYGKCLPAYSILYVSFKSIRHILHISSK